jgi:hypothetical protein
LEIIINGRVTIIDGGVPERNIRVAANDIGVILINGKVEEHDMWVTANNIRLILIDIWVMLFDEKFIAIDDAPILTNNAILPVLSLPAAICR